MKYIIFFLSFLLSSFLPLLSNQTNYAIPFSKPFCQYTLVEFIISNKMRTKKNVQKFHSHHYKIHLTHHTDKQMITNVLKKSSLDRDVVIAKVICYEPTSSSQAVEVLFEELDFLMISSAAFHNIKDLSIPDHLLCQQLGSDYVFYRESPEFEEKLNLAFASYFGKQKIPFLRRPHEKFISGDSFRSLANHILDDCIMSFAPERVKNRDIIFVRSSRIDDFFSNYHPLITVPYILITHNDDNEVTASYLPFLEEEKLLAWFALNISIEHEKLFPIPIGLPNRYLLPSYTLIENLEKNPLDKKYLAYLNFAPGTYPKERKWILKHFGKEPYCTSKTSLPNHQYVSDVHQSIFTFAPRGNGIDTYRAWEAFYLGSIPIIKCDPPMQKLYRDLPALLVNSWDEITEEYLLEKQKEIEGKNFSLEKLSFPYWEELIRSFQKQ